MRERSSKWIKLGSIRKNRDLIDLLTPVVAIAALVIPFIMRSCDKPRLTLTSRFAYKVNFQTYPELPDAIISKFYPQSKDIMDRLEPTESLKEQIKWLYQLRQFEIKIKNERNYPVSLDQLQIEDFEYDTPLGNVSVFPALILLLDESRTDFVQYPILNIGSGETKSFNIITCFVFVIEHRTPTADALFKESLDRLICLDDSLRRWSVETLDFRSQILLIGSGKEYEYLIDYIRNENGAPFIYSAVYLKYFSEVKFKSLRFSTIDNVGQKHYSNRVKLN